MIRPPRLHPGDVVRVVAPSGPVPRDGFEKGLRVLRARYEVRFDEGLFAREGFLAGPDERRLDELRAALADPTARAVVMARGGYGLLRLLPFLDPAALAAAPRPLVGFSDGTALLAFCARAGVAAVHGPVVTQLGGLPAGDQQALFQLLENPAPGLLLNDLDELIPGRVQGPLLGGNLEVFSRLLGTPFLPDLAGAILFIEDSGERPYRLDRLITHLDLAGVWGAVSAVVVGDFAGCTEPEALRESSPPADQVLIDRLARLPIPVVVGAQVGHGSRNLALPYGCLAELDTRSGTLVALEGAVS
ncbi:MAG TPA: LD-carboxypeptidase [Polyangia bacterium]|jgi:muramoyltetrapeptide carboxypeptidase|nr:LD-carboxypeptidase [Polyangia bacterium]